MRTTPLLALLALASCGDADRAAPEPEAARPVVYTTFYPTAYFAERIAGDLFEVVCPVPSEEDAIFWQPSDEVLAAYQRADLIVLNGAGFARWVAGASLPPSRVVDTAAGFADEFLRHEGGTEHSHGGGAAHRHEGLDGHTWVDPLNAERQARALLDAMVARWPAHEEALRRGFAGLATDLQGLHARLEALAPRLRARTVLCSHPAYDYLLRRHGVEASSFDLDPARPLDGAALAALDAAAGNDALLLWESAPLAETAELLLDEHGIASVTYAPCELIEQAEEAAGEDYLSVMRANLDVLEAALR
jgi:zinc transport system substrate-binding protein